MMTTFGLVAGCASNPDVVINYYVPKALLAVQASVTISCTSEGKVQIVYDADGSVKYSRGAVQSLRIRDLDGPFSSATAGFQFYPDGRLSGFNSSQTGNGQEIIEAAAALIPLAVAAAPLPPGPPPAPLSDTAVCNYVKANGGKNKKIVIQFDGSEKFKTDNIQPTDLTASDGSKADYAKLMNNIQSGCLTGKRDTDNPAAPQLEWPASSKGVVLRWKDPAAFVMTAGPAPSCAGWWSGQVLVPQLGKDLDIPLPSAPVFGTEQASIEFAESGRIAKISYGSENGTASALKSAAAVGGLISSGAEQAKRDNDAADRIAARSRLKACREAPDDCK